MMQRIITVTFLALSISGVAFAKGDAKGFAKLTSEVNKIRGDYRKDKIDAETVWKLTTDLQKKTQRKYGKHPGIFQMKSFLFQEENYYTLSLIFAREAIEASKNPFGDNMKASWHLMYDALKQGNINDLLFELAGTLKKVEKDPPVMGRNWKFYRAKVFSDEKDYKKANELLNKIQSNDFLYLAARYEMAMNFIAMDKVDDAYKVLNTIIIATRAKVQQHFSNDNRMEIVQLARLAMARIDFEREKYLDSVKNYRAVRRDSKRFYTALAEQSWPLFMAGFPNHALGMIYSAQSPFFEDRFNPELPLLKSIIYFWMCRYQDSLVALVDFIDNYSESVKALEGFLSSKQLRPMTAYQLFENALTGVSSEALGINSELLLSVAKSELMMMHRDRLATALGEQDRLEKQGIWRPGFAPPQMKKALARRVATLKRELGKAFLVELEGLRQEYQRLRNQLDFLYVELLLSEKEKLYGREMHGKTKMKNIPDKNKVKGWGKKTQSWAGDDKDEFWIDEIGFYIFDLESQCK